MATFSSANGSERDPLDIEKLAKDLERHEHQFGTASNGDAASTPHELPLLLPLSHDHPHLRVDSNPNFDVDAFLLTRSNTSLADLRTELRDYLAVLKEELVQLINDDYADFISLRTDLRGEGARIERLEDPLAKVEAEIDLSRGELLQIQEAVQVKLDERSRLREEKTLLHLLLKISDLVARLENMLFIRSPDEDPTTTPSNFNRDSPFDSNHSKLHALNGAEEDPDRPSLNRAKHLARIAVEYNQLLYHADKARKQSCVFVDQLQKRIDRIQVTLCRDLDVVFSAALRSFTVPSTSGASNAIGSTADAASIRAHLLGELLECLKIYEMLERWDSAEDVFRQEIASPFIKKNIYQGVLLSSQTPGAPKTPFLDAPSASQSQNAVLSPTTPFTPYPTTSITPTFLLQSSRTSVALIDSHLDDPLTTLLNSVLRFVDKTCRTLIELSEKVNKKHRDHGIKNRLQAVPGTVDGIVDGQGGDAARLQERFEFVGRVLWPEIGRALMDELGTMLFAAGRPDEFQKNYTIIHEFVNSLEYAAPSADSITILRSHRVYETFERRWQLPVYFQLRWKDIVGSLEDSLTRPGPELITKKGDGFFMPQARAIYHAIETCWSPSVFIPELAHRFWRVTLQMISRYKSWLDTAVPAKRNPTAIVPEKTDHQSDYAEIDEAHMRAFAIAIADIRHFQRKIQVLFDDRIISLLPTEAALPSEGEIPAEQILQDALAQLDPLLPSLGSQIVTILIARCTEPLQHVRSIPAQYRAMSARKLDLPTEPSFFISSVLKPLRDFFLEQDGPGVALQKEFGEAWAGEVFRAVATKYTSYLSGMKKTVDSLRRYNKSKRSTFALFSSSSTKEGGGDKEDKDEIRIRTQMMLDVETLAKDARSLGSLINVDESEEYQELMGLANDTGVAT